MEEGKQKVDAKGQPMFQMIADPVTFIMALNYGLSCFMFSDFGDIHVVTDADGETIDPMVVANLDEFGVVTVGLEGNNHGLSDGDLVSFSEVEGAVFLNELKSVRIKKVYNKVPVMKDGIRMVDAKGVPKFREIADLTKFQIDLDVKTNPDYKSWTGRGVITYIKPKKTFNFKSLEASMSSPLTEGEFFIKCLDDEKTFANRGGQLQLAFCALLDFDAKHGRLPALHDMNDAKEMVQIACSINDARKPAAAAVDEVDANVVSNLSLYARSELSGFCAFLGGVVAQETLKKFGKYTPLFQWLAADYFEIVHQGVPADAAPIGCRYDHQISVLGKAIQDKILAQKWFLVGCGALGCEYIKAFAMMGLGASPQGLIHITDLDRIELSNLSRQFLFRSEHIGKPKSVCAALAARAMNADLNIVCHETKVCDETEGIFNDEFWLSLDGVWNALDNIQARKYTDAKCVIYGKPLLESGTEGTKANSSVHIPGKTLSYSDIPVHEGGKIPACTLRNFPYLIVHCIEWAKPRFVDLFEFMPKQVNALTSNPSKFFEGLSKERIEDQITQLKDILAVMTVAKQRTIYSCVQLALNEFTLQYTNRIKDLTHSMPVDARNFRTMEDGTKLDLGPFWSGTKVFPRVAEFDAQNPHHLNFIFVTSNLYAFMLGLKPIASPDALAAELQHMQLVTPKWVAGTVDMSEAEGKKTEVKTEVKTEDEQIFADLKNQCISTADGFRSLEVTEFEKDDDTNFHIDFITATSNMRAWNYKIAPADRLKCKVISGRIIAALMSTTAMITGLTSLELYKLVLDLPCDEKKNYYHDSNVNLAVSSFSAFQPQAAKKKMNGFDEIMNCEIKAVPEGYTTWAFIDVKLGDITIGELVEAFPGLHHDCNIEVINKRGISQADIDSGKGGQSLFDINSPDQGEAQKNRKVTEAYSEIFGPIHPSKHFILLDVDAALDDEPVNVPPVKFFFRDA